MVDLRTDDFDYTLPPERIAQTPAEPRDSSRLLVVHRATGALEHRVFRDVVDYLRPGDLLVANDSRVLPGRLWARKPTGGRVELLLLRALDGGWWEALARPATRLRSGQRLRLTPAPEPDDLAGSRTLAAAASPPAGSSDAAPSGDGGRRSGHEVRPLGQDAGRDEPHPYLGRATTGAGAAPRDASTASASPIEAELGDRTPAGGVRVRFSAPIHDVVARYGHVPLPPYIHEPLADPERYQTVYARVAGSAAAPTAGLHFTPGLLDEIAHRGVSFAFVTLHVGPDTFRPVKVERIVEHEMHSEFVVIPDDTARVIAAAKAEGRRVIAIGTTSVRVLESWAAVGALQPLHAPGLAPAPTSPPSPAAPAAPTADRLPDTGWSGWTRLFIYPGYTFRVVDALLTNFHLPRSTLLMLISAFAGRDLVRRAYAEAIAGDYRFYSFGDASLFL